jgi:hypothetical protein
MYNQDSALTAVITGQLVTERNVALLFNGELNIGNCNALLPVEEKERLGIFL